MLFLMDFCKRKSKVFEDLMDVMTDLYQKFKRTETSLKLLVKLRGYPIGVRGRTIELDSTFL